MNKVTLMGRLVRDPEIEWTRAEESKKYAKYTLAVNRRFKKQGQAEADFIPCVAWGAMAEFAEKFMKKGGMFAVIGRLNVQSWEDKEGKKHWTTTVIVEESYFTGGKKESGAGKPDGTVPEGFYPAEPNAAAPSGWFAEQTSAEPDIEDDDLPF